MKIAIVYDRVNKIGGAERVLSALHEIWPEAPLYTAVYDPQRARWASVFRVVPSFLQRIPFAKTHHEWFAWLTPFAFNSFSFDEYDVVLSVTSAEAKNCITKSHTLHICYCLTPTRYLWSGTQEYLDNTGFGILHGFARRIFSTLLPVLREWDMIGSARPDRYIAISQRVAKRIRNYYKKTVDACIYPPVNTDFFVPGKSVDDEKGQYLFVSRLVPYKKAELVIRACTELNQTLYVIGDGSERTKLQKIAGPTIRFIHGDLTDIELLGYYQRCRAFLFAGDEDFGIVAAEAQSCGKPVIAYKSSGVSEIVRDGKTGLLFASQTKHDIKEAIIRFEKMQFDPKVIRENALRFSKETFQKNIAHFVEEEYNRYSKTL